MLRELCKPISVACLRDNDYDHQPDLATLKASAHHCDLYASFYGHVLFKHATPMLLAPIFKDECTVRRELRTLRFELAANFMIWDSMNQIMYGRVCFGCTPERIGRCTCQAPRARKYMASLKSMPYQVRNRSITLCEDLKICSSSHYSRKRGFLLRGLYSLVHET